MKPSDIVFTPVEIGTIGQKYLEFRRTSAGKGIPLYVRGLDYNPETEKGFLPCLSGELISIIARPGNGKTSIMMRWARERSKKLIQQEIRDRVVVYVTLEQSVEELHAFHVAAETGVSITTMANGTFSEEQWADINAACNGRFRTPLWFIGHSIARRQARPKLTPELLVTALQDVEKWQGDTCTQHIDMVFVDYLQRFQIPQGTESKVIYLSSVMNDLKTAAITLDCPFVVGVQAKREVDQRNIPIPMMDDGQWTSDIEQVSDGVMSLVRPRHYKSEGESFDGTAVSGVNQMLISVLKRKLGPANFKFWATFDPRYNRLDEAELTHVNLNEY